MLGATLVVAACSTLKAGKDVADDASASDATVSAGDATTDSTRPDPEPQTDAGASDAAALDASPGDAAADARVIAVDLTMSAACSVSWPSGVFQGPPQVTTSMGVIVPASNERVTLVRRTTKTDIALSSTEQRANGDILEIYARGQLFRNICNAATGPCVYVPASMTFTSDPISGTLKVNRYDVGVPELDIELVNVVLQSVTTADYCTVSGRVRATR
jgi:hypothetical protein